MTILTAVKKLPGFHQIAVGSNSCVMSVQRNCNKENMKLRLVHLVLLHQTRVHKYYLVVEEVSNTSHILRSPSQL